MPCPSSCPLTICSSWAAVRCSIAMWGISCGECTKRQSARTPSSRYCRATCGARERERGLTVRAVAPHQSSLVLPETEVALKFAYCTYQQSIDFLGQFLFRNDPEAIELSHKGRGRYAHIYVIHATFAVSLHAHHHELLM